jgi:hypothetical protein
MADNPQVEVEVADNSSPTLATSALQTTGNTRVGDLTETAPASDTASSGLNGRLQRIAQRITSLIALLPTSLGQKNMAGSLAVVVASDQSNIPVTFANLSSKPFVVLANSIQIGNGKSMISLVNASGSTVKVKIRQLWIKNVQTSGVTGIVAEFQMKSIVGHSAGTALTPKAYDSTDTLNGSVTARSGATVTSEGTSWKRWLWSTDEWGPGPADVESADHVMQSLRPHYDDNGQWKTITLNANEGIHIKQVTNSTVGTFDLELVFTVEG